MKVLSVVGARPQFVKASALSLALREAGVSEVLVHTDQHYDENMSDIFFRQMGIPRPDHNLGVGSGSHAVQTGECMKRLEAVCLEDRPDVLNVYGDTNSTLAGGLVGAKLGIPVSHVEAGLRSFDRSMPEEVNRVVCDQLAAWCFCSTEVGARHLAAEGVTEGVHVVGDIMFDVVQRFRGPAREQSTVVAGLGLEPGGYGLVTIHRDFNTDRRDRLAGIVAGLFKASAARPLVFPVHPRVRKQLQAFGLMDGLGEGVRLIDPVGYLDMLSLLDQAAVVITDSGGLQKEAMWMGVPCVTVRPSTEWVETVELGWNRLVEPDDIGAAAGAAQRPAGEVPDVYGGGDAARRIAQCLA